MTVIYKMLAYRRGTARRAISVEILSVAAQLYEKILFEKTYNRRMTLW